MRAHAGTVPSCGLNRDAQVNGRGKLPADPAPKNRGSRGRLSRKPGPKPAPKPSGTAAHARGRAETAQATEPALPGEARHPGVKMRTRCVVCGCCWCWALGLAIAGVRGPGLRDRRCRVSPGRHQRLPARPALLLRAGLARVPGPRGVAASAATIPAATTAARPGSSASPRPPRCRRCRCRPTGPRPTSR